MSQAASAIRRGVAGVAATAALLGPFVGAGVAQAADSDYLFYGASSGAQIQPTSTAAPSWTLGTASVFGGPQAQSSSGSGQSARQPGAIAVGAVATTERIVHITSGWQIVSTAKSGRLSLLKGAVTATSVITRTTVSEVAGKLTTDISTKFVNLHVAGTNLPTAIPANYAVKLGTQASMVLNAEKAAVQGDTAEALGSGIRLELLKPAGKYAAGTVVSVSQAVATVEPAPSGTGHTNAGYSYGSRVIAPNGSLHGIEAGPSAPVTVFAGGTDAKTVTNSVATVPLGQGLSLGAVTDSGFGQNMTSGATTITTSKVSALSLFDGTIKALGVTADASASSDGGISGTAQLVNLVIGGKAINLNAGPNTTITLQGLGRITINQQIRTAHGITVRALFIVLSAARDGLPIGSKVQIGVAQASAT